MYTAPDCAARAALQALNCQCAGSRGKAPRPFSWGIKRGIFSFSKENSSFFSQVRMSMRHKCRVMRPPFSFPRKKTGGVTVQKKGVSHCKRAARRAAMLADCTAHSAALPRLKLLYDLPLLLSSAVAQPLAALLPYGCGTPLAGAALLIL